MSGTEQGIANRAVVCDPLFQDCSDYENLAPIDYEFTASLVFPLVIALLVTLLPIIFRFTSL